MNAAVVLVTTTLMAAILLAASLLIAVGMRGNTEGGLNARPAATPIHHRASTAR